MLENNKEVVQFIIAVDGAVTAVKVIERPYTTTPRKDHRTEIDSNKEKQL